MKIDKFLGIVFLCHQRADRSFFIKGKQFPLCARCTGILFGYILGIILAMITACKYNTYLLFLIIPMIIDGGVQYIIGISSNNWRRLFTGLLGGIGIINLFITIHFFTVKLATFLLQYLNLI